MGFVKVASTNQLAAGTIQEVSIGGKTVALVNVGGKLHAISSTCLHRGGPLGQGTLEGNIVTCPWHGWQFDVTTGKAAQNSAVGVDCYPLEVRGDDIFIDVG